MTDLAHATDEQLALRCQEGSLEAFEELMARHEGRLFHFLCQKMRSREDAEDVAQKTFITAWQRIHQYRTKAAFATWLYTIARNFAISHFRKHGKVTQCNLESVGDELVQSQTPADELLRDEQHADLWRVARATLKDDSFDIIWLRYQEHHSIAEISRVVSRPETTVKVKLHRARKALARALESEEEATAPRQTGQATKPAKNEMTLTEGIPCSA